MRIKKEVLELLNNKSSRLMLAVLLDRTEQRIISLLRLNPKNSILTLAAALKAISKETGLSQEEILTEEVDSVEPAKVI